MKKLLAILILCFYSNLALAADIYHLDPDHTNINWSASHFGFSKPSGKFARSEGIIILDEANPTKSSLEVTIDTRSIITGIDGFDNHLKSEDFFNVVQFPTAKFVSSQIITSGKNRGKIKGDLTLLGVTKPITLEARLNKIGINPFTRKKTAGFSAAAIIKRSDFGMNFGIPGVSDKVKIEIEAEAIFSSSSIIKEEEASQDVDDKNYVENNQWKIIKNESIVSFEAKQANSAIKGDFTGVSGSILFDKNKKQGNEVKIEIETSSIRMSFNDALDVLKKSDWLDINSFKKAIFIAKDFKAISDKKMIASGNLTIKNKTIPVNFNFEFTEYTKTKAVAKGSFKVNRKNFGIGNNDNKVDDQVEISFIISATK